MQRLYPDETSDAPPEGVLPEKGGPERGGPSLHEVFAATSTDGGVTGSVLAHLAPCETVLWAQNHQSRREAGRPSIAGLSWMLGGMPDLLLLDVNQPRDVLWAMEQALGCPAIKAVVGEVWGDPRVLDFTATKRLAMRSEESGVAAWLVRREATADLSAARENAGASRRCPPRRSPTTLMRPARRSGRPRSFAPASTLRASGWRAMAAEPVSSCCRVSPERYSRRSPRRLPRGGSVERLATFGGWCAGGASLLRPHISSKADCRGTTTRNPYGMRWDTKRPTPWQVKPLRRLISWSDGPGGRLRGRSLSSPPARSGQGRLATATPENRATLPN